MKPQRVRQGALGAGLATAIAALTAIAPLPVQADPGAASPEPLAQGGAGELVLPFTDVSPDHWAYEALLNLAGRYSCIEGYPDGTFRGEATVTRNEFAAAMDSCLRVMTGLAQQQQSEQNQAVQELIEAMEQSLKDLRQLETELPATP